MSKSAAELETALKWIGMAERSGQDGAYRDAAERSRDAVDAVLRDEQLWAGLKKRTVGGNPPAPDPHRLHIFLGDRLVDVLVRVGYQPPPEAAELVGVTKRLVTEAADPRLPALARDDLAGAFRTWLVTLQGKLYEVTEPAEPGTDQPEPVVDIPVLLRRAKAPLVCMVVVDELAADNERYPRELRVHALDASMNLVVRWLSCMETAAPAERR